MAPIAPTTASSPHTSKKPVKCACPAPKVASAAQIVTNAHSAVPNSFTRQVPKNANNFVEMGVSLYSNVMTATMLMGMAVAWIAGLSLGTTVWVDRPLTWTDVLSITLRK